jgi:hypothetical protein
MGHPSIGVEVRLPLFPSSIVIDEFLSLSPRHKCSPVIMTAVQFSRALISCTVTNAKGCCGMRRRGIYC